MRIGFLKRDGMRSFFNDIRRFGNLLVSKTFLYTHVPRLLKRNSRKSKAKRIVECLRHLLEREGKLISPNRCRCYLRRFAFQTSSCFGSVSFQEFLTASRLVSKNGVTDHRHQWPKSRFEVQRRRWSGGIPSVNQRAQQNGFTFRWVY